MYTLWNRQIKNALRHLNISHTQFVVLAVTQELNDQGMLCTQKEISDFSMIDVMTLSTTLKRLLEKKWVNRVEHPWDTRAKIITNTEAGKNLLKAIVPIIEQVDTQFFGLLNQEKGNFLNHLKLLSGEEKDASRE